MSKNNLSVVSIAPQAYTVFINEFAAACGCGPNNLNKKLIDGEGNVFFGCHSQWRPSHYAQFSHAESREALLALMDESIRENAREALTHLYERCVLDEIDPLSNWHSALRELELKEQE